MPLHFFRPNATTSFEWKTRCPMDINSFLSSLCNCPLSHYKENQINTHKKIYFPSIKVEDPVITESIKVYYYTVLKHVPKRYKVRYIQITLRKRQQQIQHLKVYNFTIFWTLITVILTVSMFQVYMFRCIHNGINVLN